MKYKVTAESLNVRERPSTEGKIIGVFKLGTVVELQEKSKDEYWFRVTPKDGWVSSKYLMQLADENGPDFPWLAIAMNVPSKCQRCGNPCEVCTR